MCMRLCRRVCVLARVQLCVCTLSLHHQTHRKSRGGEEVVNGRKRVAKSLFPDQVPSHTTKNMLLWCERFFGLVTRPATDACCIFFASSPNLYSTLQTLLLMRTHTLTHILQLSLFWKRSPVIVCPHHVRTCYCMFARACSSLHKFMFGGWGWEGIRGMGFTV